MKLDIYTNHIPGGWLPDDLEQFLGGNEETLALFTPLLAKHFDVTVWSSLPDGLKQHSYKGVSFRRREDFPWQADFDILMTFKERKPWVLGCKAKKAIHWSQDVEQPWAIGTLDRLDEFIYLCTWQGEVMSWKPKFAKRVPLGINPFFTDGPIDTHFQLLYNTSPDRGLITILKDWAKIRQHYQNIKLIVTYNWSRLAPDYRSLLLDHCDQDGIEILGSVSQARMIDLYEESAYWINTLNNPNSDLAGVGAIKAQLLGCVPIIPKDMVIVSGLKDSIDEYIAYEDFREGKLTIQTNEIVQNDVYMFWDDLLEEVWLPMLKG